MSLAKKVSEAFFKLPKISESNSSVTEFTNFEKWKAAADKINKDVFDDNLEIVSTASSKSYVNDETSGADRVVANWDGSKGFVDMSASASECKKTVSEAKFDDGEVDDIYGMLPAVADEVLSQIGLKQYKISASEGKLDTAYQSKGTLYLNIPVDLKTIGPMSAIISKLTLSFQLQKLDKVGPKDEVYWCPIDFKYEHPDGGSNGHQIATVWLTADGDVVGIRKVGK